MKYLLLNIFLIASVLSAQNKILIYMDLQQTDHLKAYGIAYSVLADGETADWLLNYRGGSFLLNYSDKLAATCRIKGVAFDAISGNKAIEILSFVQREDENMDVMRLEKAPKIAVYVPPGFPGMML
jgi:hypothetical protein